MRLFAGIPLGTATIRALSAFTASLMSPQEGLRWTSLASWHITLQFLGSATDAQYACVLAGLKAVTAGKLRIDLDRPGSFERSGVFFVGVRPSDLLEGLALKVMDATKVCGYVPENRPFRPHITLARGKGENALRSVAHRAVTEARFPSFIAEEFVLYESFLGQRDSRYEIRARFPLKEVA